MVSDVSDQSPGLPDCYGDEFDKLYQKYVTMVNLLKRLKPEIYGNNYQFPKEVGTPYMLYKIL